MGLTYFAIGVAASCKHKRVRFNILNSSKDIDGSTILSWYTHGSCARII